MMTDARVEWAPAPQEDAATEIEGLVVSYGRNAPTDSCNRVRVTSRGQKER